ncbi:hypothetical protein [Bradyrhizobium sp. BWC-3-1]|uniref:hypothetical protein n=1 Tax=Bradyrhizobium sp. BWC-3-1 TaxID=3080012 RepID=UPI00293ECCC7|nr:hypothetical protein [Bradyrhizobium sp. BWC-3-1]WOH61943.1 hypothetical protein RX329_18350 [Bradyrhizobium sp. BWC-3-1]
MFIDKYKTEHGDYEFSDGCHYDTAADLIQCGVLEFCGCGASSESLSYVRDGLAHIDRKQTEAPSYRDRDASTAWWNKWQSDGLALFGNERARWFFYYWADNMGFTEHGGSVPGWLTNEGKELLADLIEITKGHHE